ncbi:MAG TPA: B12-binding domain-containing protein [Ktedonobacterales bacterium]
MNERPFAGNPTDVARYAHQDITSLEPPILENYRDAPIYDHNLILELVRVRPIALWALEQHLGISSGARGYTEQSGQRRRYSERDLVALLWMKERVVAGEPPHQAGARLVAAQRMRNSGVLGGAASGALRPPAYTPPPVGTSVGQLGAAVSFPAFPHGHFSSTATGNLTFSDYPSGPHLGAQERPVSGGPGAASYTSGALPPLDAAPSEHPSGAWTDTRQAPGPRDRLAGVTRPISASGPLGERAGQSQTAPRAAAAPGWPGVGAPVPITRPSTGFDPARDQASARELRNQVSPLLDAFSRFDTRAANRIIQQALEQYNVEVVCLGIVQPTIARVSELWSRSELTLPEERFTLSYLRGFLNSVFHSTMEPETAPVVVVGCAHRDSSDLPALLLSVFMRRSGLRVVYLGADAGSLDLAQQRWASPPALITLTLNSTQRIRSVNSLAKQLRNLAPHKPELCYTGSIFARSPDLQRKVNAVYLGDDPAAATSTARRLLGILY